MQSPSSTSPRGSRTRYRKARKAFRHAYEKPSDEAFHAWRKKVQQHWRHMSLLSRGWPEAMSARASEAKELSRLLGEDHDFAVLLAFVSEQAGKHLEVGDVEALAKLCRTCQDELRAQARPRGERLFAERPQDLEERVHLYWTNAACLAALARAEAVPKAAETPAERERSTARRPPWARRRQSGVPGAGSPPRHAPRPLFVKWARHKASHSHEPRTRGAARLSVAGATGLRGRGTLPVRRVPCSIGAAAARSCCRAE